MTQKERVLAALKELGHKVSAADVAARTGFSLHDSRLWLNKIAQETRATLKVSPRGEICYEFFSDLETIYKIAGLKKLLLKVASVVFSAGFFVLRVSFGILLLASVITLTIVFAVALVFILFGVGAADADGDMGDGGGLDFEFFDWDMLAMFFSWGILARHRTPTDNDDDEYLGLDIDTPDKGFFNNCFSFLFGEGNPNRKLVEKQWQYIAELIRRNQGVITAGQVKPYLLKFKSESRSMLDVLVRFDGSPEVTQGGNIVYCFPSLQVTASGVNPLVEFPEKLLEKEWKFSKVPGERLQWVFFFAGANLCGAYALNKHLVWFQPLYPYADLIHLVMVYAAFFMGFPILREITNGMLNSFIELRNKGRSQAVQELQSNESRFKLNEARQYAFQLQDLQSQAVVYTTGSDILPQDTDGLAQQIDALALPVNPVMQQYAPEI